MIVFLFIVLGRSGGFDLFQTLMPCHVIIKFVWRCPSIKLSKTVARSTMNFLVAEPAGAQPTAVSCLVCSTKVSFWNCETNLMTCWISALQKHHFLIAPRGLTVPPRKQRRSFPCLILEVQPGLPPPTIPDVGACRRIVGQTIWSLCSGCIG